MAKVGDIVRYLNSVGGGRIVRIEGNIAYVDEDGFETPVMLRECVVVGNSSFDTVAPEVKPADGPAAKPSPIPVHRSDPDPVIDLPFIETASGEKLNVVLAFEAANPGNLSDTTWRAYLVNDSNYYLSVAYLSRSADFADWKLRRADVLEPGIQLLLEEFGREDIPSLERICLQVIAYKADKPFALKRPANVELKIDTTKFFKLHCLVPNPYFDSPVIAFDVITDDRPARTPELSSAMVSDPRPAEKFKVQHSDRRPVKKQPRHDRPLEVDLHITELLDTTAGLSPADMLNHQIDTFRRVMDENLRNKGSKIIFIHGKGDGVLRKAILRELAYRYKNCRWQDASFREYGFGATQVEIH